MFVCILSSVMSNRNVSVYELAEKLNCSVNVLNRIKQGKLEPSLEMAIKISKIMKCNVNDIFDYC